VGCLASLVRCFVTGGRRDKVYEVVDKLTKTWRSKSFLGSNLSYGATGFGVVCHASNLELRQPGKGIVGESSLSMCGIAPRHGLACDMNLLKGQ
jgi:hypothetical protein